MSDTPPLLEEANAFRPAHAADVPVFRQDYGDYTMFYAPGTLCVVSLPDADWFETTISRAGDGWGGELWRRASDSVSEARRQEEEPFRPECLTLYMNNECNLGCTYCHTDPVDGPAPRLALDAIAAAAELVAENCQQKGRPLYGVFHGGGEPTLHRERVERALALLEATARAHGVDLFRYVATNGAMSEEKAVWLAHHFDLVGLSCDGPADIHNAQRPYWDGRPSSSVVERTGRILRQEGCRLHVRTTITGASFRRQVEIASTICDTFAPEEIHFEPVYRAGRTGAVAGLRAHQATEFVAHFLEAREIARRRGVLLMTSGTRPDEIHGPYCHVFRETLNLVPGGVATACFKVTHAVQAREKGVITGALNRETGRFELDHRRVQELRHRLSAIPAECADCFNRYHCVRGCPDHCPLDDSGGYWEPGFRCPMQKALAYAILREAADCLWSRRPRAASDGQEVYGTAIFRSVLPAGLAGD